MRQNWSLMRWKTRGMTFLMRAWFVNLCWCHVLAVAICWLGAIDGDCNFSSAAAQAAGIKDNLTDSQGHVLVMVHPQRFEQGARDSGAFNVDHAGYNSNRDDAPIHPVVLTKPFLIGRNEVSRGQFATFVRETGYRTTAEENETGIVGWLPLDDEKRSRILQTFRSLPKFTWRSPGFPQSDFHPVVGLSYHDAKAYCSWLSEKEGAIYRLPTEAEWECVARAGTKTFFSFGDTYQGVIQRHANLANNELENAFPDRTVIQWFNEDDSEKGDRFIFTAPVGSFAPNPWGMHDMHGNVWEWCEDRYLDTYYERFSRPKHRAVRKRAIDPVCEDHWNTSGDWRVIRGGSWCNSPIQARSSVRSYFNANDAACYVGMRIVREADQVSVREARQRFLASSSALEDLQSLTPTVYEDVDGHLELRFRCNEVSPSRLSPLEKLDDSVRIEITPPGKLTVQLINAVAQTRNLKGVIFRTSGEEIDSDSFSSLRIHPELQHVQITGLPRLGNKVVSAFQKADALVSLHLQGDKINDIGLNQLIPNRTLVQARLSGTASAGHFLSEFVGAPLSTVSFSKLDDQGAGILGEFPSLRDINLRNSPLTNVGLKSLLKLRRLQVLTLDGCVNLTDAGLAELAQLPFLERLSIQGTMTSELTCTALPRLNRLRNLRMDGGSLGEGEVSKIGQITSLRNLTIANLSLRDSEGVFRPFKRLVNLKQLELSANNLPRNAVIELCQIPSLRVLEMASPSLTNDDMSALSKHPTLQRLTVGGRKQAASSRLESVGLMKLCDSNSLREVRLIGYRDQIPDKVIESLSSRNENIRWSNR